MKLFPTKLRRDQIFFLYILLFSIGFFMGGLLPKYVAQKIGSKNSSSIATTPQIESSDSSNGSLESSASSQNGIYSSPTLSQPSYKTKGIPVSSTYIAYIQDGEVWVSDTNNWSPVEITSDEYEKFMISISPDRTKITYAFYPDNPKRRTNLGAFDGFHSGVGWVSLVDGQSRIVIPYGDKIQHQYPQFSNDNRFISVWTGNGRSSEIYDTANGRLVRRFESEDYIPVSPISFIPKQSRISLVKNNKLVVSNVDGSGEYAVSENAEPLRSIHEGQIVPIISLWSTDGKYVSYQSNGDLKLFDTSKRQDITVVTGMDNPIVGGRAPQGFASKFTNDNKKLIVQDVGNPIDVQLFTIEASTSSGIGSWGNSLIISPDTGIVGGTNYLGQFESMILSTGETKTCEQSIQYPYYTITAGKPYQNGISYFSTDGSKILVQKSEAQGNGLSTLNVSTCELVDVIPPDTGITEFTWFP